MSAVVSGVNVIGERLRDESATFTLTHCAHVIPGMQAGASRSGREARRSAPAEYLTSA